MIKPTFVTVYPTKPSALLLIHPTHGELTEDGANWPKDNFTNRRLTDGSISLTKPGVEASSSSVTVSSPVTSTVITTSA